MNYRVGSGVYPFFFFLSAKVRCTRMDKGRGAFRDVVFGVSRPERLSVVCVEEFREA